MESVSSNTEDRKTMKHWTGKYEQTEAEIDNIP